MGMDISALEDNGTVVESLYKRMLGRFTAKPVFPPENWRDDHRANEMITDEIADEIVKAGITTVNLRSVFTCACHNGTCAKCYGMDLATGSRVNYGESVGTIAAQAIGEPGTQLTMRTFHTGGVAGGDITQGLPRVEELFEARKPKGVAVISEIGGKVSVVYADGKQAQRSKHH